MQTAVFVTVVEIGRFVHILGAKRKGDKPIKSYVCEQLHIGTEDQLFRSIETYDPCAVVRKTIVHIAHHVGVIVNRFWICKVGPHRRNEIPDFADERFVRYTVFYKYVLLQSFVIREIRSVVFGSGYTGID